MLQGKIQYTKDEQVLYLSQSNGGESGIAVLSFFGRLLHVLLWLQVLQHEFLHWKLYRIHVAEQQA